MHHCHGKGSNCEAIHSLLHRRHGRTQQMARTLPGKQTWNDASILGLSCGFDSLKEGFPECEYTKAREFRRAMRLMVDFKKKGMKMLSSMSRHCINNVLYQTKLPLSDVLHGANKMCPHEVPHTLDAGLTIYMFESLQGLISGGESRENLDSQHVRMSDAIPRQSERNFPRGATRSGLIDSTRCQLSERKGNLFLLLCIDADGALTLQHELNYTGPHWKDWLGFLKLYLSMEEWFHDARPKEEVCRSGEAVVMVMEDIQRYFPRSKDSHGYKIPKMHGLSTIRECNKLLWWSRRSIT